MFVPLHVKSDYSLGYGTASVDELVGKAAAMGYDALTLTDLENLYGQVRFHHQCRAHGIRPITGLELRTGFDGLHDFGERDGRLLLLAADRTGYRGLCRIISRRRVGSRPEDGEDFLGRDPLPLLAGQAEGLFALSDDSFVLERLVAGGDFPRDRLGLLLVRPGDRAMTRLYQEAAHRLGVRLLADLDVVFLEKRDYPLHLLQIAVRQGRQVAEVTSGLPSDDRERWLRTPAEVAVLFSDIPEAMAATVAVAEACHLDLCAGFAELPGLDLPPGVTPDEHLRRLCEETLASRHEPTGVWTESHGNRLNEELAIFEALGLSGFILVVAEIVAHCREKKIPVAARGSAVSSVTLYLLGASPVDPLAHGLFFERFLHAGKTAWPDVDLDLPWHRRDEVIDWVYGRFGRERVAMVSAHHTFQRRSALREGLKAWGVQPALIRVLSRALPPEDLGIEEVDFLGLADAVKGNDWTMVDQIDMSKRETLGEALPVIQRLIGRLHHLAAHPGGMVIGHDPLRDLLPLELAPKGVVVTQYDLAALAELGFVKIDLLGNRCLSEIEETLELVRGPGPPFLEVIPTEDPVTLDLINRAETLGCFQLESPAMRSLLARLPIRQQSDLVAALSLIRPGAAAGEAKAIFVRRALGQEPDEVLDPVLNDRLGETHGLLLYEEDIMVLLSRLGGLNLAEADEMRSAIVRSNGAPYILGPLEASFLERARAHLGSDEINLIRARRAWAEAARLAAYTFNKAHAASYGQLAYFSAYMKAHHVLEFACALLNHHQGLYPLRTLAGELSRLGVELRPPHVNVSDDRSVLEGHRGPASRGVRVGLDKMKGLSLQKAAHLLAERGAHGPFASLRDLLKRVQLSTREVTALVLSGSCDGLPPLAAEAYPFVHEAALQRLRQGYAPAELDGIQIKQGGESIDHTRVQLYQALVRVRNELRYLEMHLTAHPMALLRPEANRYGCLPIDQASAADKDSDVRLAVTLAAMRRVPTQQGPMQFLTLEDETGLLEAVVLPPQYRRLGERVTTPGPFLVEGKLRRRQGAVHMEVSGLFPFHKRAHPFGTGGRSIGGPD